MTPNWNSEWPTKPGLYWLFGWMCESAIRFNKNPELLIVDARECGPPEKLWLSYVCHGSFLYKSEGAKGFWQPITMPELPTLDDLLTAFPSLTPKA